MEYWPNQQSPTLTYCLCALNTSDIFFRMYFDKEFLLIMHHPISKGSYTSNQWAGKLKNYNRLYLEVWEISSIFYHPVM
jgi:hypothetical protein